jgi:hypothetical protein
MSIKVKLTAVAIATASAIFSFSVPSQAGWKSDANELCLSMLMHRCPPVAG